MTNKETWRWNVDDVWLTFSSAYMEMKVAQSSKDDITRYHHLSASLLFGGCAIESFLNSNLRSHLEQLNVEEKEIYKQLRYTSFRDKLKKWPKKVFKREIENTDYEKIITYLDLRNEVTHRKRRDHSLYTELDYVSFASFIEALQKIFCDLYESKDQSFPHWLLGWNFVGMNNDPAHPFICNNQQFKYALRNMGFNVPATDHNRAIDWENKNMKGFLAFKRMYENYYCKSPDIEPRHPVFDSAPRLCKKWWDREYILAN